MPVALLIALVIGFGFDVPNRSGALQGQGDLVRVSLVAAAVLLPALLARACSWWVVRSVSLSDDASSSARRRYGVFVRALEALVLVGYAAAIHYAGWKWLVEVRLGLRKAFVIDEFLVLLPFLLAQLLVWWGLYPAEQCLKSTSYAGKPGTSLWRFLVLRARQSFAMVLPIAIILLFADDCLERFSPGIAGREWAQVVEMAIVAVVVVVAAPIFVRLMWPARKLEEGPLRDRLERLSNRYGFRCSEILVWDTGNAIVNAGVTGVVPWFRYVLLTDAMVARLEDHEIESIFGHEIGHIAKRHFQLFGLFFLASVGVLALIGLASRNLASGFISGNTKIAGFAWSEVAQTVLTTIGAGAYFLGAFGWLSRRFEREADVFGCQVVSCGIPECPPHLDRNSVETPALASAPKNAKNTDLVLCPVGIRIFARALADVASLNGINPGAPSWRHGGIAKRIRFIESLEASPKGLERFINNTRNVRLMLGLLLVAAGFGAYFLGAFKMLAEL